MKNNTMLYVIAVIVLDVIAAVSVINSSIDPKKAEYNKAVAAAEDYSKKNLCGKAIKEYEKACDLYDSSKLRIKIAELYEKGYENGEFASIAYEIESLDSLVNDYPNEVEGYEKLVEVFDKQQDYESCAKYVSLARKNKIESEAVDKCYEKIRTMYTIKATGYDTVECNGYYQTAKRNVIDDIEQYDENGEPILEIDSEGNSYVKTEPREFTEFTFYDLDGTIDEPYKCVDMSHPSEYTFENKEKHTLYFYKNYGNDLDKMENSDVIYSSLQTDNIRQCYFGEENEYTAAGDYSCGIITLYNEKSKKYDLFSTSGKLLAGDYDFAGCYSEGSVYVEKAGDKSIIDTSGKTRADKLEDVITAQGGRCSFLGRMFVKFDSSGYKLVDSEDMDELDFVCDNADLFIDWAAAYEKGGKWGFVDKEGKTVIEPQFEEAKSFSNGYAAVKKDGKWGFINKEGEIVIETQFDDALYFSAGKTAFVFDASEGWELVRTVYME